MTDKERLIELVNMCKNTGAEQERNLIWGIINGVCNECSHCDSNCKVRTVKDRLIREVWNK